MKISELVAILAKVKEKHGDEVLLWDAAIEEPCFLG